MSLFCSKGWRIGKHPRKILENWIHWNTKCQILASLWKNLWTLDTMDIDTKLNFRLRVIVYLFLTTTISVTTAWNLCTSSWARLQTYIHTELREYENIIQEQLAIGIIEKIPNQSSEEWNNEDVHYLPHHEVIRKNRESTSLRIVYDGSAKSPGQQLSLNDCLPTGPNYIPQLADVLVGFHWNYCRHWESVLIWLAYKRIRETHFGSYGWKTHILLIQRSFSCDFVDLCFSWGLHHPF